MSKFEVVYYAQGKLEIEAEDLATALKMFKDKAGFSEDELYDNLDHNFVVWSADKV